MAEYKKFLVRHGSELTGLIASVEKHAAGRELSRSRLISDLVLALARRLESRELVMADLSGADKTFTGRRSTLVLNLEASAHARLISCATAAGVAAAQVARMAIILHESLLERGDLEQAWRDHGEPGSPRFLSDAFLRLWNHHVVRGGGMDNVEARLFAALRAVDLRVASLCEQMESFEALREYAVLGMKSGNYPSRHAIRSLRLEELRKLARMWDIKVPQRAKIERVRADVLHHFKYT